MFFRMWADKHRILSYKPFEICSTETGNSFLNNLTDIPNKIFSVFETDKLVFKRI